MRPSLTPFLVQILAGMLLVSTAPAAAEYWERQFDPPPHLESDPSDAPPPDFGVEGIHILCALEVMTDLGRKQIVEIDRLAAEREWIVGIYSRDRAAREWPRKYIEDFRRDNRVSLPIFSIDDEGLRGVFKGYDPGRMQAFPHTLLVDGKGGVHRILTGVQSSETLAQAIEECRDPSGGVDWEEGRQESNLVLNGKFEEAADGAVPVGWGLTSEGDQSLILSNEEGWEGSKSLEIRSKKDKRHRIAFQVIPHDSLLGREATLRAMARSNSIGAPRVALAVPHPQYEEGIEFVPAPVLRTRSDREIPLRIVAKLDFEPGNSRWGHAAVQTRIPEEARALVLILYLENPNAPGGAARFDNVHLAVD